jgi:DNA-binding NarL/FixJ family response regulator
MRGGGGAKPWPSNLDSLGLLAALQKLFAARQERSGVRCIFTHEGKAQPLDDAVNITLYRVAQEALTNVLPHARAQTVRVVLARTAASEVRLSLQDDGCGMAVGAATRGLLADDHSVVRSGYLRLLDQAGDIQVVREASHGDAAYAGFIAEWPDVVVFSMHDRAAVVAHALAAGAQGYVSRGCAPHCLIDAVRALHAGQRYLSPELAPALAQRESETERLAELSAREFETFRLLAQGHSVDECARELKLSPKTIANHQTFIKEKLGVATLAALAHLAIRQGVICAPGAMVRLRDG